MELCENKSVLYSFKNLGFRKKEKLKEITKKKHERKQKTVGSPIEMRDPPMKVMISLSPLEKSSMKL